MSGLIKRSEGQPSSRPYQRGTLKLTLFASVLAALVACTKELPYKQEYKEDVLSKSLIDTNSDYLYVASYQDVSRSSDLARPYWQGSEKLVRFRFSEKSLQVVELDKDERFSDNPRNTKLVFEIPVDHLEYRCAEDRLGECKNEEEENKEIRWSEKTQFKPDFNAIKVSELNILPVELSELFGEKCYSPSSSQLLNYELDENGLEFQIERVFKVDLACLGSLEDLSDATVSVVYHYSLRKLTSVASADYEVVDYPDLDESTFGFFSTESNKLDVDHRDTAANKVRVMNRWNPSRSEIKYYLSQEFMKPENEGLRLATYDAFERINRGLREAGVRFRLKLEDYSGQNPGDLRHSMIIMVEDPIASGLLGYGPSVTNPRTGEIISAKTVMYPGVMKRFIRSTYEDLRKERELKRENVQTKNSSESASDVKMSVVEAIEDSHHGHHHSPHYSAKLRIPIDLKKEIKNETLQVQKIRESIQNYHLHELSSSRLTDRIEAMSAHCTYPAELFNFDGIVSQTIDEAFQGDLKPWDQMTEGEKKQIVDRLLPHVWIPTLIHEVGHNLGLRHNFKASEDKENWYSEEELKRMGINRMIPYSSVMDYSYSDLSSLPTLGKYDIAALRFGYQREVETNKGIMKVGKSISAAQEKAQETAKSGDGAELKFRAYGYCTDEHVGANPGCKRFDEGTTLTEIAQHYINQYHRDYLRSNFRDDRRNYSLYGDLGYAGRVSYFFQNLRTMYETYERVRGDFKIPDDAQEWESLEFLKDLRQAAVLSANFFADVVATPDVQCFVAHESDLSKILGAIALADFSQDAVSCYDSARVGLNKGYVIVGQGGKSFQSKKDPNSSNPYLDQIDVRGIWIDKIIALEMLYKRQLGVPSFDRYSENMLTLPGVEEKVTQVVEGIIFDALGGEVSYLGMDGHEAKVSMGYGLFDSHLIPAPLDPRVAQALDLAGRGRETLFVEQVLRILNRELPSELHLTQSRRLLDRIKIFRDVPSGRTTEEVLTADVGAKRYFALPNNTVAAQVIQYLEISRIFDGLDPAKIQEILNHVQSKKELPNDASEQEKLIYALGAEVIQAYLSGVIQSPQHYERILAIMPLAN